MFVMDTGLRTGGAHVVVMDVATMGMAIVPIVEFLDWGWRVRGALGGMIATAAIEGHATALVVPPTVAIASVKYILPTTIVGGTSAAAWLSLLALVLLLATLAALCLMPLVSLLWVLKHACRRLVANCIAEHLELPLHGIDGGIVVT